MTDGVRYVTTGWRTKEVILTVEDIALLRSAQASGQLYSSDNEGKWSRVLTEADLLEAVPDQGVDWYGGWVRLSEKGRQFLAQIDADAAK